MKIYFVAHDDVTLHKGGPYVKIINSKKSLEALGVDVHYFDYWNTARCFREADCIHMFGSRFPVYNMARNMHIEQVPFVVNPIFFTRWPAPVVRAVSTFDKTARRFWRGFWWDYGITRDICDWAQHVLPNTQAEGDIIAKGMGIPPEKCTVIHNGVSAAFLQADPTLFKKKYGLENFILTVGHMGPDRKNVLRLLQALERIDYPAVFIGRKVAGGETPRILELARRNKNLLILDELANDDPLLASAYAACDTFVLPSKFETPGRAALEAALAGAKIVITALGGTKEYFAAMAEYVDPFSVDDIVRGIQSMLNQPKNPALSRHIEQNFTWDKLAQKTIDVYRQVLANRSF